MIIPEPLLYELRSTTYVTDTMLVGDFVFFLVPVLTLLLKITVFGQEALKIFGS